MVIKLDRHIIIQCHQEIALVVIIMVKEVPTQELEDHLPILMVKEMMECLITNQEVFSSRTLSRQEWRLDNLQALQVSVDLLAWTNQLKIHQEEDSKWMDLREDLLKLHTIIDLEWEDLMQEIVDL